MKKTVAILTVLVSCILFIPSQSFSTEWLKYAVVMHSSGSQAKDNRQLKKYRDALAKIALSYKGTPYVWGGNTPKGFDCSGFIRAVYKQLGVDLPRTAVDQGVAGAPVKQTLKSLRTGDLIYFKREGKSGWPHHVGMYLKNGYFIHCTRSTGVTVESFQKSKLTESIHSITRILFTEKEGRLVQMANQFGILAADDSRNSRRYSNVR